VQILPFIKPKCLRILKEKRALLPPSLASVWKEGGGGSVRARQKKGAAVRRRTGGGGGKDMPGVNRTYVWALEGGSALGRGSFGKGKGRFSHGWEGPRHSL